MKLLKRNIFVTLLLLLSLALTSCFGGGTPPVTDAESAGIDNPVGDAESAVAYIDYNDGVPRFDIPEKIEAYEKYSPLDELGRCGVAEACLGLELMPTEEREPSLSSVTPSGWNQAEYPEVISSRHLYNRCHLIGFQLAGEQANKLNLITGTRFMNIEGMLTFEDMVADYIKETGNHVMYRVTPVYADEYDLVASGVIIEGLSLEDGGEGINFAVYSYNIQPGVVINYRDGSSYLSGTKPVEPEEPEDTTPATVVINKSSKRFHLPTCSGISNMNPTNREDREYYDGIYDVLTEEGYQPCGTCKPTEDKTT